MDRRSLLSLATLPLTWTGAALALEQPEGPVVLTLRGKLRNSNRGNEVLMDMAMLERLPHASYSTRTPWYSKPRKFSGPLVRDLMAAVGAHGTLLRAIALNDYQVDIPMDDVLRHDVLLARLLDDKPMSVRDKGPLFIIYPFDQVTSLRNTVYYSRCAWQLKAIEVL